MNHSKIVAVVDTIHAVRLSEAIKEGDFDKLLTYFSGNTANLKSYSSQFGNLLHLAVSFGSKTLFEALVRLGININAQNCDGNTPLHLAAKLGRQEIVDVLLSVDGIDDTIINVEGKTAIELSKTKQISSTIECKIISHYKI